MWAVTLPAAAALAFAVSGVMRRDFSPPRASEPGVAQTATTQEGFKPVAAENLLYAVRDEGVITLSDGTEARRERLNYVDTITWKNPRTNASLIWSVPREEVRVVPVTFQ